MFGIGMPEMLLILAVALIVIGPKKLPDLAKSLGRALGEFKRATTDLKDSIESETQIGEVKTAFKDLNKDIKSSFDPSTLGADATSSSPAETPSSSEETSTEDPAESSPADPEESPPEESPMESPDESVDSAPPTDQAADSPAAETQKNGESSRKDAPDNV